MSQYKHLFDSPADAIEDSSMKIPSSSLKEQELSAKVILIPNVCLSAVASAVSFSLQVHGFTMKYTGPHYVLWCTQDVLLPVPPKTGWSKVTEFVFGL